MPSCPPGGALFVVIDDRVDRRVSLERPQRIRLCRQTQPRQDRAPDKVAHTVDGVAERDTEAVLDRLGGHCRDPADDLAQFFLADLAAMDELRTQTVEVIDVVE